MKKGTAFAVPFLSRALGRGLDEEFFIYFSGSSAMTPPQWGIRFRV